MNNKHIISLKFRLLMYLKSPQLSLISDNLLRENQEPSVGMCAHIYARMHVDIIEYI
jgi:hypothetical protein